MFHSASNVLFSCVRLLDWAGKITAPGKKEKRHVLLKMMRKKKPFVTHTFGLLLQLCCQFICDSRFLSKDVVLKRYDNKVQVKR